MHAKFRFGYKKSALTVLLLLLSTGSFAVEGKNIAKFYGYPRDGQSPFGGLVADATGALYGTTFSGGSNNGGTVFKLTPPSTPNSPWQKTLLYAFGSTGNLYDGYGPMNTLTLGKDGSLYGTTYVGGQSYGTAFKLTPPANDGDPWTETQIYVFLGGIDGAWPYTSLIFDQQGNLYGGTLNSQVADGGNNGGVVFELTPPKSGNGLWHETTIYNRGSEIYPTGQLIFDQSGNLYGTTSAIFFQLVPPSTPGGSWTENDLHIFECCMDGYGASGGLVMDSEGALYGTTTQGGSFSPPGYGTVYKMTPPAVAGGEWTESVLYGFMSGDDGSSPSGVILGGNNVLYGVTTAGGYNNYGTVFQLSPPRNGGGWKKTLLRSFVRGSQGGLPGSSDLLLWNKGLYGTTINGGFGDHGTAYEIFP